MVQNNAQNIEQNVNSSGAQKCKETLRVFIFGAKVSFAADARHQRQLQSIACIKFQNQCKNSHDKYMHSRQCDKSMKSVDTSTNIS